MRKLKAAEDIKNVLDRNFFPTSENNAPEIGEKSITFSHGEFIVRSKKRYNKRFKITILGDKNQTFTAFTKDISVGGMNLETPLPDWVVGYFKVRIGKTNSKQQIELTCCLVEATEGQDRSRIAILPLQSIEDEKNLEGWLAA